MGEMADYMLNGDDCKGCGEYLGDGPGYPRLCGACDAQAEAKFMEILKATVHRCPDCGKRLRSPEGVVRHRIDKHSPSPRTPLINTEVAP